MNKVRDIQLDNYRALVMIYILCVSHVLHWLLNAGEPILSVVVIGTPVIFFVSGAALSVSRSKRGIVETVINRLKRIVVPFYIYAIVAIVIAVVATLLIPRIELVGFRPVHLSDFSWTDALKVIFCQDVPHIPYMAHLWFIIPYLILACSFPLQVKLTKHVNRHVYFVACILLFVVVQSFTQNALIREVLCYNVFIVAGYLYYRKCDMRLCVLLAVIALAALLINEFLLGGHFSPLQDHKFPPDWVFCAYSLFVLCLVSLVFWKIRVPQNRLLRIWNKRGYTMYLYQSVIFAVVAALRQHTYVSSAMPVVRVLTDAALVFVLSTALSYLTYPLERYIMDKLK